MSRIDRPKNSPDNPKHTDSASDTPSIDDQERGLDTEAATPESYTDRETQEKQEGRNHHEKTADHLYDRKQEAAKEREAIAEELGRVTDLATEIQEANVERRDASSEVQRGLKDLQEAIGRLEDVLTVLVERGPGQTPELGLVATTRLEVVESRAESTAAADESTGGTQKQKWRSILEILKRVSKRLWGMLSHLLKVKEWALSGEIGSGMLGIAKANISITFG